MKRLSAFFLVAVAAGLVVVGFFWRCAPTPSVSTCATVSYEDLVGREVKIPREVRRIVLLRSKDVYLLAALLGEDLPRQLIAWGPDLAVDDRTFHQRLLARFPHLRDIIMTGDVYSDGLDVEQLVRLHPDLIIADKFMRQRKYAVRLEMAGIPLVYLNGSDDPLTAPQKSLRLLGAILHREETASRIADYLDAQIRLVTSRIATHAPAAPWVYLESGSLGPGSYGPCYGTSGLTRELTSWGTILCALRVHSIAEACVIGMAPIQPESLLKADPQIIVITGQDWSRYKSPGAMHLGFGVEHSEAMRLLAGFAARPGWNQLDAVKNHHVYAVFHNTVSPTVFAGIQALAAYCYPDIFRDVDPDRNLKEFYDRFMPVPLDGTWACRWE